MWKPILSIRFCFEPRSSKLFSVEFLFFPDCLSSISTSLSYPAARRRSSHLSYSLTLSLFLPSPVVLSSRRKAPVELNVIVTSMLFVSVVFGLFVVVVRRARAPRRTHSAPRTGTRSP